MSAQRDIVKRTFPGKRVWYFSIGELDEALALLEELPDSTHLRAVYSLQEVIRILAEQLKWPVNKIDAYIDASMGWASGSARAPIILPDKQIEEILRHARDIRDKGPDGPEFAWH